MALLILNVGTGQRAVVSFIPEERALSINLIGRCVSPEPVWLFKRTD